MISDIEMRKVNPIKEIMFSVSFAETINDKQLEAFVAAKEIEVDFDSVKKSFNALIEKSNKKDEPSTNITKSGVILKSSKFDDKIIHLKRGLFIFHKTKEYQPFDTLLEDVSKYWGILQNVVGILTITSVNIRYINFIEKEKNENIEDLLTIFIKHSFEEVSSSLFQIKYNNSEDIETRIVGVLGTDEGKNGVILDLIFRKNINNVKFKNIKDAFSELRSIKNSVFSQTVTNKTKEKYSL